MTEEWTEQKEKTVLRRYRYTLIYRIISVGILLFLVYTFYVLALTVAYDNTSRGEKLTMHAQLLVDWTHPGISSEHTPRFGSRISPLLTQSTSRPIYRKIGKEEINVGEFLVKKPLILSAVQRDYQFYQQNEQPRFNFYLPFDPETGDALGANQQPGVWETLEKVHEGTVADLAFSTKEYSSPEEIFALLDDYDIDVNWMALYMGELKTFSTGWQGSSDSISPFNPWGLTHGRSFNEDYMLTSTYYLAPENVEEVQGRMLTNMKRLYENDPSFADAIFGNPHFEERIGFLETEGFKVYGAVVTGPTKELLRLKELDEIHGEQLGKITFWNWVK